MVLLGLYSYLRYQLNPNKTLIKYS